MGEGERSRLDAGGCRDSDGTKHWDKIHEKWSSHFCQKVNTS